MLDYKAVVLRMSERSQRATVALFIKDGQS
jgi:hypothetical protein